MRTPLLSLAFFLSIDSLQAVAAQSVAALAYAPVLQACPPGTSLVRQVGSNAQQQTLSPGEAAYVSGRQTVVSDAWRDYLTNVQAYLNASLPGTSLPQYIDDVLSGHSGEGPKLGIATSGGGYRAAIFGAGVLNALDARNQTSRRAGTGGILQAATYLAGLSGGSWLVSSLSQANFPMLPELLFGPSPAPSNNENAFGGWLANMSLLFPGDLNVTQDGEYIASVIKEVSQKKSNGFPVTLTDVWARALSRHFVNGTTAANFFDDLEHGAGITFSSITNVSSFLNYQQPFPIVVADSLLSKANGSAVTESGNVVPLTNPIYEFNPFEMGTFDPQLGAFTPMKYLGSPPTDRNTCVTGFDQVSYIEGISSDVFNEVNSSTSAVAEIINGLITALEKTFEQSTVRLDSSAVPNAFFGLSPATFPDSNQTLLTLVDGGEDGEVDPLQPLLVKARGVDTIIAIDASAGNLDYFAEGNDLISTQARVQIFSDAYAFPPVPTTTDVYLSQNLTRRPTFFGCNSSAESGEPLVIYIANGGPPLGQTPVTNTPSLQLRYKNPALVAMLDQTFDITTQGIPEQTPTGALHKDPEWPACLACALADRARRTVGVARSGICGSCLERYCWS